MSDSSAPPKNPANVQFKQAFDAARMPPDYDASALAELVMDLRAARAFLEHETATSVLGGVMKHPNGGIHKTWWNNLDFRDRLAFAEAIGRYRERQLLSEEISAPDAQTEGETNKPGSASIRLHRRWGQP